MRRRAADLDVAVNPGGGEPGWSDHDNTTVIPLGSGRETSTQLIRPAQGAELGELDRPSQGAFGDPERPFGLVDRGDEVLSIVVAR